MILMKYKTCLFLTIFYFIRKFAKFLILGCVNFYHNTRIFYCLKKQFLFKEIKNSIINNC